MVGIVGNGKLLAKLDDSGTIEYLFYPQLGFEKHIFDSAFALHYDGKTRWHWDYSWNITQKYLKDTNVLETIYENDTFLITSIDYITVSHDILVKKLSIINKSEEKKHIKLFFYENLRMGEHPGESTVKFMKGSNCIVKYDNKYICSIGSNRKVSSYQCGVRYSDSSAYKDVENGLLKEQEEARGTITDSALCWDIVVNPMNLSQKITIPIYIVMREHGGRYDHGFVEVINTLNIAMKNWKDLYNMTLTYWKDILENRENNLNITFLKGCEEYRRLKYMDVCKRSILTIMMLCSPMGGIIASPSLYPDYRYVWNRDGSYMVVALDICGITHVGEKFFHWCRRTQNKDGSWTQNYYIDGNPRFTGMQNDQVGTTLWAILIHYRVTNDRVFLKKYWDMVRKGANYLANTIETLSPCYDLWEERYGVFAYTLGATYGGLKSACNIFKVLERENFKIDSSCRRDYSRWLSTIENLRSVINRFYLEEECRFAKSINPLDKTIDTSILGLSFPYNLIPADDPRMISTALQVESAYSYLVGGIGRYPGDVYFGGNPWIITTLWLAMYYKRLVDLLSRGGNTPPLNFDGDSACYGDGEDSVKDKKEIKEIVRSLKEGNIPKDRIVSHCYKKYHQLLHWVLNHRYNELLPEQIHKDTGAPLSAIPLGWSHAFTIMAVHLDNYDILIP
ncbi:MAG TPA: glycosyl hydrolase [Methanothermococcus okinawensis]|nr:glycosyl hydrolase [Methanothermococcus okinawensis]